MNKFAKYVFEVLSAVLFFGIWYFLFETALKNLHKFTVMFAYHININDYVMIPVLVLLNLAIPSILSIVNNEVTILKNYHLSFLRVVLFMGGFIVVHGTYIHLKDSYFSFFSLYPLSAMINVGMFFVLDKLYKFPVPGRIVCGIFVFANIMLYRFLL